MRCIEEDTEGRGRGRGGDGMSTIENERRR